MAKIALKIVFKLKRFSHKIAPGRSGFPRLTIVYIDAVCNANHFLDPGVVSPRATREPRKALCGGIQRSMFKRSYQLLAINAHKMAPRTGQSGAGITPRRAFCGKEAAGGLPYPGINSSPAFHRALPYAIHAHDTQLQYIRMVRNSNTQAGSLTPKLGKLRNYVVDDHRLRDRLSAQIATLD